MTLGPSSARGQEAWVCPDTCLARPRGAAPSYGETSTAWPGSQPAGDTLLSAAALLSSQYSHEVDRTRPSPSSPMSGRLAACHRTWDGKSDRTLQDGAITNSSHGKGTFVFALRESKSVMNRLHVETGPDVSHRRPWEPTGAPSPKATQARHCAAASQLQRPQLPAPARP